MKDSDQDGPELEWLENLLAWWWGLAVVLIAGIVLTIVAAVSFIVDKLTLGPPPSSPDEDSQL